MTKPSERYWDTKTLEEMTQEEWESLCDGCGLCCLTKLQDEDTDEIVYTSVVCVFQIRKPGSVVTMAIGQPMYLPVCL